MAESCEFTVLGVLEKILLTFFLKIDIIDYVGKADQIKA